MGWGISSVVWRFAIGIYAFVLLWHLYMLEFPVECSHMRYVNKKIPDESRIARGSREEIYGTYKEKCYMPHWHEKRKVTMSLYVGLDAPEGAPVWTSDMPFNITEPYRTNISFPVPRKLRPDSASLRGFVYFRFSTYDDSDKLDDRVSFKFNLTDRRRPLPQNNARLLLNGQGNQTVPDVSASTIGGIDLDGGADSETPILHWRFSRHPMVLRFGKLFRVLHRSVLPESGIHLKLRKRAKKDPRPYRHTEKAYNPVLWLDDLSITRHHYKPVVFRKTKEEERKERDEQWEKERDRVRMQKEREQQEGRGSAAESVEVGVDGASTVRNKRQRDIRRELPLGDEDGDEEDEDIWNDESKGDVGAVTDVAGAMSDSRTKYEPPRVEFELHFVPTSMTYLTLKRTVKQSMGYVEGIMAQDEVDELRYYMHEDRLWSMFLTQVIGWTHIVLEYMAFQGEWAFYQGRRNFIGLSVSSVAFAFIRNIIILLYLHDQHSSWFVLSMVLKDALFTLWKLVNVVRSNMRGVSEARAVARDARDAQHLTTKQELTEVYDAFAFKVTASCMLPFVAYMAYYSLQHNSYTSWWSWFISSLADSVYLVGFASMVPQIYINYKFKSVAHLPLRPFLYKIFNTFIDDVFAFSVKMPLKHRLMTFRDDIVFVVFVYQWYIYPIDKTRVNEFGFQYEKDDNDADADAANTDDGNDFARNDSEEALENDEHHAASTSDR